MYIPGRLIERLLNSLHDKYNVYAIKIQQINTELNKNDFKIK